MPGTWPTISRSSRPSICPSIDPSSTPSFTSSRPLPPTRSTRSSPSATFSSAIVSKPQPENSLSGLISTTPPTLRQSQTKLADAPRFLLLSSSITKAEATNRVCVQVDQPRLNYLFCRVLFRPAETVRTAAALDEGRLVKHAGGSPVVRDARHRHLPASTRQVGEPDHRRSAVLVGNSLHFARRADMGLEGFM